MKKKLPLILILLLMAIGVCALLYPAISNQISKWTSSVKIAQYQKVVSKLGQSKVDTMWKAAQAYNATLSGVIKTDAFSVGDAKATDTDVPYRNLLNVDGIMGYVEVPSINVYLPIYHGTSEQVLQIGAGHLEGSALPVGGAGTNAVITAHRGLPAAKLFTDLDQMEIGDKFYLHILGHTLAYQIDKISVIEPDQTQTLNAVPGEDHATLLTCTPYGINTQRLVVRGIRVNYTDAREDSSGETIRAELIQLPVWIILAAGIVLISVVRIVRVIGKKRNSP